MATRYWTFIPALTELQDTMERVRCPNDAPSISVALCTHNGAAYLREQIRSICEQTLVPDEIVLSDDASSDESVKIAVEEVATRAVGGVPVLRVLQNATPLGVTANFEQAIRACTGELIALCDQDDVWRHDRIERIAGEFARGSELLLLHSDARIVGATGQPLGHTLFEALAVQRMERQLLHSGRAFEVFLRRNLVTGATAVLRRSLLHAALPIPKWWLHDEWLGAIASCIGRVGVLEEPLIDYRQHAHNLVGARRFRWRVAVERVLSSRQAANSFRTHKIEALLERVTTLAGSGHSIDPGKLKLVHGQLTHQLFRVHLPTGRGARIIPIAREITKGNYQRFGPGLRVAVADLLQRA